MIEFQSVRKQYDNGTVAVHELSLVVETGTITVFVGPSGCGKTTLMRMVNRMIDPSSGTVLVNGTDVRESDPARLRRGIGYVIQQAGLFPHRTVLDNVATVPLLFGQRRREARSRAGELLELVGLPSELGKRYPAQLSGGQQQRVGVARALAADPPVLLMDEPFSAVDPVVREGLQDELLRLQAELDKTVLFVTHDIDEAIKLGEKVAVLRQGGHLAQYAEPDDLLAEPADDFVTSFVGRDRGYRRLSFVDSDGIRTGQVDTVRVGETARPSVEWQLALDADGRPRGWLEPGTTVSGPLAEDQLVAGGSLYTEHAPLRGALDAALSAPSGLGVVVDADGGYVGVVTARHVLDLIERRRDATA
ncbi:osmoprotectant transport system ATP-binding protein [Saccharopolyspora erythraea NRRL 2338]|uniref:ATP-binding cassette domain-containing protein n=1 Tax=Saccharopolyspora erythraea TaxID=1836 RepID=A0ABN1D0R0_SACER|nr:ABC transporter ATP-binding protein [Saccharopolyspora erythraea]EQD87130.1 ABC transporter [Saccharopolyspora erythraea D]PFG99220.1 osmoprotectant transport system ATP-binding protein [Saccharopolyspora erythraea NRRL 2338]QRK89167.1 ABC transporter ATP-binding protein [Saccharopolyspora erythraea]